MNLVIIGVGSFGYRHLQSLYQLIDSYSIYAVEVNQEAIEKYQKEMPEVCFVTDISRLPTEIEVAIIATNANIRRILFERLIEHSRVKNVIFDKVLFQREEDYYFVQSAIKKFGIHAWVNCARREWESYKRLKKELQDCRELHFSVVGGNWGMACNTIHMLDLIEFLTDEKIETIDISGLENHIVEAKRKGFFEFFGTIKGTAGKCKDYIITCVEASTLPSITEIETEKARYQIFEGKDLMRESRLRDNWEWKEIEFQQVYQSRMTSRVVKTIMDTGACNLAKYEDSMELHLKYIRPLIEFFKVNGLEEKLCPIT